jgi:CRP/FNR family transcriptional regulator
MPVATPIEPAVKNEEPVIAVTYPQRLPLYPVRALDGLTMPDASTLPASGRSALLGLPREYSDRLLASTRPVALEAGQTLFRRGDAGDGCYWLDSGTLKVMVASEIGEERILAVLGPGSIVGEFAVMDGLPRSATVVAMRPSTLQFLSRAAFQARLQENPSIYQFLVSTLVERLRQADEEAAAASFLTVKARVARALLNLATHLGAKTAKPDEVLVHTNLRQSDLAALAGVVRESVSRTLSEWRRSGTVVQRERSAYLINLKKLSREAVVGE